LVIIDGKQSGCESCKKAIERLINMKKIDTDPHQEMFYVSECLMSKVAGENRSNVRRIESIYNVQVTFPSSQNGRSEILVTGLAAENVYAAKEDILMISLP